MPWTQSEVWPAVRPQIVERSREAKCPSRAIWSLSLCDAYTASDCQNQLANWTQDWNVQPAHFVVCRACGCGDNTMGHWTRWCVVPLICYCNSQAQ